MSSHPANQAAVILTPKASPLAVQTSSYVEPQASEIVIYVSAVAINPVDWAVQAMGPDLFPWVHYPTVPGSDVAGTVHAVGSAVTRFRPGDRAAAVARSFMRNRLEEGGFQDYVTVSEQLAFPLPEHVSHAQAAVLPLGFVTAAAGLFSSTMLALSLPTCPAAKDRQESLFVWGAASSVGSNAVQLARAAGYHVVATCSAANFDLVKECGASVVVDYKSSRVVPDVIQALAGTTVVGCYDAIRSEDAFRRCAEVLNATIPARGAGEPRRFIAAANMPPAELPQGIQAKFIVSTDLTNEAAVCAGVFADFIGPALAAGQYRCVPAPEVVGKGLESVQHGFEVQKKGVSAKKIVVTLRD